MIGLDTNVVVRYLTQDDPHQSAVASTTIESLTVSKPGYLSIITVVETYWVLRRSYGVAPNECVSILERLADARELHIGNEAIVRQALTAVLEGLDLADAIIGELGRAAGCEHTVTFDRGAARGGAMTLLDS